MKKLFLQISFFLLLMLLTFYALFQKQNLPEILEALSLLSLPALAASLSLALFFVSAEGFMIWYLLHAMHGKSSLFRCIRYSFIGFFYSGITPSATGGQPMQLYYLQKDGNKASNSTVVLMTVALIYKFVLVIIGIGILLFGYSFLRTYLKGYFPLYLLGLFLNTFLVILLILVMWFPRVIWKTALLFQSFLIRINIWKPSAKREEKITSFITGYQQAVVWLTAHKKKLAMVILMTFVQRISVFLLTYIVYLGFHLQAHSALSVMCLQATVYIAVDMLPLPGAQGITELMYQTVFSSVFPQALLLPSMLVSRGINFYFLLILSLLIVLISLKWNTRRDIP
ncbi:MAG: flippase-like domain-containing protein [Ruminococcus sp.]|nr:flippase-like domain-containing protein [Ruminococcus sp.]